MKVIEQYFPNSTDFNPESEGPKFASRHRLFVNKVDLFILKLMLYKVVLSFESVDEILKCDHSNESY